MDLIDEGVLLDEEVLGEATLAFGVPGVVVGVDLVLVGQRCLVVEHAGVRRRADADEFVDEPAVAVGPSPGEGVVVEDAVGRQLAHHLSDADERRVLLRRLLHGEHPQRAAPRLAGEVDGVLPEPVAEVVGDVERVGDDAVERERRGRVERRVRVSGAPLIPRRDRDVLFELRQVAPHRPELGPAGTAGEEQQHRVVDAVPADHDRLVVAVHVDLDEFGHAALQFVAVGSRDRIGAGRSRQPGGQHDQPDAGQPGHGPSRPAADRASTGGVVAPVSQRTGDTGADGGTEQHRQQRHEAVDDPTDHEGEDAVGGERGGVDRGAIGAEAAELEQHREGERGGQHRPARVDDEAGRSADDEADGHRPQRRGGGQWAARGPPGCHDAPERRGADADGDAEPAITPHRLER